MKKKLISCMIIGVMALGMFALTGCGSEKEKKEEKSKIVIGLDDTFAPMGFRDESGKLVGFDIDLANAVGKELGKEVEFKPIDWNAKEAELKAGTIDCVWNGMSATPERKKNMALTSKYLDNKIILMSLKKNNIDVKDATELAKLKIGTQEDSSALEVLKSNKEYVNFKGNIKEYNTYDTAIMDLKAGRVDVIAVDQVLGNYTNKNLKGELQQCTYSLGEDFYVIGFEKNNKELRDKVDKALKKLVENGTAGKISKEWFGKDIAVYQALDK